MVANNLALSEVSRRSKIHPTVLIYWKRRRSPMVQTLDKALNSIGYKLTITKVENAETL
jgi:hypothetical protein